MFYPVHYVYLFHSIFSTHSYLREGAIDNYDTIFCVGEHHVNEIKETEKVYGLKPKKLIKYGFGRLDTLINEKKNYKVSSNTTNLVLIAPSYGSRLLSSARNSSRFSSLSSNILTREYSPESRYSSMMSDLAAATPAEFGLFPARSM